MGTMNKNLIGKRIAITGASGGVGAALARLLISECASVALIARRFDRIEALAEELGPDAIAIVADVSDPNQVSAAFQRIDVEWGGLDALVNNAALAGNNVFDTPVEEWKAIIGVNLLGYMYCAREAANRMKGSGGQIVNVGSLCVRVLDKGCDVYVASKMGVQGFTDSFRKEVAPDDILVTMIHPGQIASEMVSEGVEAKALAVSQETMLAPEDVAETIAYCLSRSRRVAITEIEVRPRGQIGL